MGDCLAGTRERLAAVLEAVAEDIVAAHMVGSSLGEIAGRRPCHDAEGRRMTASPDLSGESLQPLGVREPRRLEIVGQRRRRGVGCRPACHADETSGSAPHELLQQLE